jgi:hypothetical protein
MESRSRGQARRTLGQPSGQKEDEDEGKRGKRGQEEEEVKRTKKRSQEAKKFEKKPSEAKRSKVEAIQGKDKDCGGDKEDVVTALMSPTKTTRKTTRIQRVHPGCASEEKSESQLVRWLESHETFKQNGTGDRASA